MLTRLIRKELLHYLLDLRFVFVFTACILLSVLSVYVGTRNYVQQVRDYQAVSNLNREILQVSIDKGELYHIDTVGYLWNRRPEALSSVVFGLSGTQGKEVNIHRRFPPLPETSQFETDPVYAMFEVLDLALIVKVVLSLSVLLFTYDAICGEKEGGTLRLYASFPVTRSRLAGAKLIGTTLAVLVPMVLAFLLTAAILSLSPGVRLTAGDWGRMGLLMGIFSLYLAVFTAFGLLVSSLTHHRMTAFLSLLGLWMIWLFVVPNAAVDAARRLIPAGSVYDLKREGDGFWWEKEKEFMNELTEYGKAHPVPDWRQLTEAQRQALGVERGKVIAQIRSKGDARYIARFFGLHAARRDRIRNQQRLAMALSAFSPLSAASFASMDLARTGFVQQERTEDALYVYLSYLGQYIQDKTFSSQYYRDVNLKDFVLFTYEDQETLGECLTRNTVHILNLALLAILGYAGAYVAILRYDVR